MYSVSRIVHCVEIACKDLFFIQQHSNKQSQALQALVSDHSQHFFGFALHFRVCNYIFFPFPWIRQFYPRCIDLLYSPWCMFNLEELFLRILMKGVENGSIVGTSLNMEDDTPFKAMIRPNLYLQICTIHHRIGNTNSKK